MAAHRDSLPGPVPCLLPGIAEAADFLSHDLEWPFGKLEGLDADDVRETAYEIFFAACRSSPAFSGRSVLTHHSSASQDRVDGGGIGNGSPSTPGSGTGSPVAGRQIGVGMAPISKVKKALGLKMLNRSQSKKMVSWNAGGSSSGKPSSPSWHNTGDASSPRLGYTVPPASRPRRPLTSAEIMRQQMRVTEQSDNRLRKTLMRTLVGQMGRRVETIILPLELLRHIKPSEFSDMSEYHRWQKRQLKVLEVGLLLHPAIPLEKSNAAAVRLKETILSCQDKALDIGKSPEAMRMFCDNIVSLSWRSPNGTPTDVCHWADGFPLSIHLYVALLQCVFDMRDETYVMDEVDELLELMKKTWSTLGINKAIHNVCFAWVLFQQYTLTSEMEPDLLFASHAMLAEVSKDAKKPERDAIFVRILTSALSSIKAWSEKRLHNYHDYFQKGKVGLVESILPLALTASTIYGEEVLLQAMGTHYIKESMTPYASQDHVDEYIQSSLKNAFSQLLNNATFDHETNREVGSKDLVSLADKVEELALREREHFTSILKKRQPAAARVAVLVLHNCYGVILKLYLSNVSKLSTETAEVLQRAEKLEKFLVQMVVEDCIECEDLGKSLVKEMVPYEVDRVILMLLKQWTDDWLKKGKECLRRAKETESWNPKSKTEPYTQSVVDLMKLVKEMVDEFFNIPIGITEDLIQDLADTLGHLFQEYIAFVASCGSKQGYLPSLPPLTRCHRSSSFSKFWKKATLCTVNPEDKQLIILKDGHNPRPSTSRGTQRLYVRLNTLHYLLTHLHSLNKTLSLSPKISPSHNHYVNRRKQDNQASYFDVARASILTACQHVSEVAACRLIFADSSNVLYDSLYIRNVAKSRIRPVLRIMKQNLSLLCAILTERAQPLAVKEIMKACFEAYLMVLLAGGRSRIFNEADQWMVKEDFESLKRVFCSSGEGLMAEDLVQREAEKVEGVIALMGTPTEQLIEEFSIVTCEASGIGVTGMGQKLLMPPTTRRWHRSDPNTILRVLCHRNDRTANHFLKKSFHLTKR